MHTAQQVSLPQLAIVLGNEISLAALRQDWAAYPDGASYTEFRELLEPYLQPHLSQNSFAHVSSTFLSPKSSRHNSDLGPSPITSLSRIPASAQLAASISVSAQHVVSHHTGGNRGAERSSRIRSRQELAGVRPEYVDPIKQLFNHVDIHNQQRVTWEHLVNYLVSEAIADRIGTRFITPFNQFTFSRMLQCAPKTLPQQRKRKKGSSNDRRKFVRYFRDVKDRSSTTADEDGDTDRLCAPVVVHEDGNLGLIRFLDGLPGHKSVFFVSTRSCPFMLYSKDTLQHIYTAPPDMFPGVTPSIVTYLEACDLMVCYSSDDRLLRGWFSLLSRAVSTTAVTPLLLDGLARRVQIMPRNSPSYLDYQTAIFLGDSLGSILCINAPRGRKKGKEFTIVNSYPSLHTCESGGLVDFCVFGTHLYSSGFDGRLLATSLLTGQSIELGCLTNEHLTTLVYIPGHEWVVGATSCGRRLLWWDAHAHGTLPGTPFDVVGNGEHNACIISLIHLVAIDQLVSADTKGVVKIWDVASQQCVQSFRSDRVPQLHGESRDASAANQSVSSLPSTRTAASGGGGVLSSNIASLFVSLGLLALLPAGVGQASNAGGPQCHSLIYCESTQELLCGFVNSIVCWSLNTRTDPLMRDDDEVCSNVLYDIRTRTFLVQGATRLSVWDGVHGHRRGVLSQIAQSSLSQEETDIKAVCIDELGSRVFISRSDGCVVWYSTQDMVSNASQCTSSTATLWWKAKSSGLGPEASGPVTVHQMYFSSISRTWLAITSNGMLLIRTEGNNQEELFSTAIAVCPSPLTLLRVSEDMGLAAVADAQCTVYMFDMQLWMNSPVTKDLSGFGGLVDMVFLGHAPGLVTVHTGGVCRCWSCAPAVEHFRLLSILCHPQHPSPDAVRMATVEAERITSEFYQKTHFPNQATSRGRQQLQRSGLPSLGNTISTTNASSDLFPMTSNSSPLNSTIAKAVSCSRPASGFSASPKKTALRSLQFDGSNEQRSGSAFDRLAPDQVISVGDPTSVFVDLGILPGVSTNNFNSGTPPFGSGTPPPPNLDARGALTEFTSVAYDGRNHHLFLGDSDGVVHIYRTCRLLKAYNLPHCSHKSRTAFSLAAVIKLTGANPSNCETDPELLTSVRIQGGQGEGAESNAGSSSASTHSRYMSRATPTVHHHHQCGVMCARWIDDRGVLAASTYDHEVWFLNGATGEVISRLSTDRPPPRLDHPERIVGASKQRSRSLTQDAVAPSGILDRQKTDNTKGARRRNTFILPQVPVYEDMDEVHATGFPLGVSARCCCTHGEGAMGAGGTEDALELSLEPQRKGGRVISSQSGETRIGAASPRQTPSFLSRADGSSSILPTPSVSGMGATAKLGQSGGTLNDYMEGSRYRRSGDRVVSASTSFHASSRPHSQYKDAFGETSRGYENPLSCSNSSFNLPYMESDEVRYGTSFESVDGSQIHLAEWQRRHLETLRASRGIKDELPVPPGLPNTLVQMEESKAHGAKATGQPVLYEPAEGVSPLFRTTTITVVLGDDTESSVSPSRACSVGGSSSGVSRVPPSGRPRCDEANKAPEAVPDITLPPMKGSSVPPRASGTTKGSLTRATSPPPLDLCVSGSPLATRTPSTGKTVAADDQPRKSFLDQRKTRGRTRSTSSSVSFLPDCVRSLKELAADSSASELHGALGFSSARKRALAKTECEKRTSCPAGPRGAFCSSAHGAEAPAPSYTEESPPPPPSMLAYSNELEGVSTLKMYSNELHRRLRRSRGLDGE